MYPTTDAAVQAAIAEAQETRSFGCCFVNKIDRQAFAKLFLRHLAQVAPAAVEKPMDARERDALELAHEVDGIAEKPGAAPVEGPPCPNCKGRGFVDYIQNYSTPCHFCGGSGNEKPESAAEGKA